MKFGQLHLFENPMGRTEKQIVDEQFDIMARAEEFGFDSLWPAERHFGDPEHGAHARQGPDPGQAPGPEHGHRDRHLSKMRVTEPVDSGDVRLLQRIGVWLSRRDWDHRYLSAR